MRNGARVFDRLRGLLPFGADPKREYARRYEEIVRTLSANSPIAGAYGALLGSYVLNAPGDARKSLLVSSTQPSEGKTTVVINLGITAMLSGQNILLIDGDLRRPNLHRIMGLQNEVGFSELLVGNADLEETLQYADPFGDTEGTKRMAVISSGTITPHVVHALGSPKARAIIKELEQSFDLVLVDSSPALAVNDAVMLASAVDGVIFVVDTGDVGRNDARRAKQRIERSGTPIIGAVLNRFDERQHGSGVFPYYGYYYGEP